MRVPTWFLAVGLMLAVSPLARAQDDVEAEAREVELDAAAEQGRIATGLYVSGAVLAGGGVAALVAGSIASLSCGPMADCAAATIAIAIGGISAVVGLVLFIVATFVDQGADERRRRVLRESLSRRSVPGLGLELRF